MNLISLPTSANFISLKIYSQKYIVPNIVKHIQSFQTYVEDQDVLGMSLQLPGDNF